MSAAEWADVVVRVVFGVASLGISLLWFWFLWHVWKLVSRPLATRHDVNMPTARVFLRRMYCRHRHVARIRSPLGRHYTACVRCGTDVNEGKRREDWR